MNLPQVCGVHGLRACHRGLPVRASLRRGLFERRGSSGSRHRAPRTDSTKNCILRKVLEGIFQQERSVWSPRTKIYRKMLPTSTRMSRSIKYINNFASFDATIGYHHCYKSYLLAIVKWFLNHCQIPLEKWPMPFFELRASNLKWDVFWHRSVQYVLPSLKWTLNVLQNNKACIASQACGVIIFRAIDAANRVAPSSDKEPVALEQEYLSLSATKWTAPKAREQKQKDN